MLDLTYQLEDGTEKCETGFKVGWIIEFQALKARQVTAIKEIDEFEQWEYDITHFYENPSRDYVEIRRTQAYAQIDPTRPR